MAEVQVTTCVEMNSDEAKTACFVFDKTRDLLAKAKKSIYSKKLKTKTVSFAAIGLDNATKGRKSREVAFVARVKARVSSAIPNPSNSRYVFARFK